MNYCPICKKLIKLDHIFCSHHWFQVPAALRAEIWRLARTQRGSVAHRRAILQAIAGFEKVAT